MELLSHQARQERPNSAAAYVRQRPETTLLYQIVQEYWPAFQAELASHDKYLPAYVLKEFDEFLKCGRLEHGFLRVRCESCHDEKLVAFSCKKRGFAPVAEHDVWPTAPRFSDNYFFPLGAFINHHYRSISRIRLFYPKTS